MVPFPEMGVAQVWWARPNDARPWFVSFFNDEERQRLTMMRRHRDRQRFAVGCALMRMLAGSYLGRTPDAVAIGRRCYKCGRSHGKPRLAAPHSGDLQFSISHSGHRVVVVCTRQSPIGVDVESIGQELQVDNLIELVLSPLETESLTVLCPSDRLRALLVYWARKEAVLKATGHGLDVPMPSVTVTAAGDLPRLIGWPVHLGNPRDVSLHDLSPGSGYVATLAVIGRCEVVVDHDGSALLAAWASSAPTTDLAGRSGGLL